MAQYFESTQSSQKTTLNYIIRRDTGMLLDHNNNKNSKLVVVLLMPDNRYQRTSYNRLLKINGNEYAHISEEKQIKHNWVRNLENIIWTANFKRILQKQICIVLKGKMKNIKLATIEILHTEDP